MSAKRVLVRCTTPVESIRLDDLELAGRVFHCL
jgi:hypothetical protein